jgi:diguanylate cyclase (GGDEF)-like protein
MNTTKPHKILFIDDDPLIRQVVRMVFAHDNYVIIEAESGAEGIEKAQADPPDLILLDVMMPAMDGYQVLKRLRENLKTANVPIVMLTALGNMGEKIRGLETGADDYIIKPFDPRELRSRVEAHLRRSVRDLATNPLTHLPGNPAIEQIMRTRIPSGEPLAVLYFDLSDFKAYNDEYGWIKGDSVIQMLAKEITEVVSATGDRNDFVGHIGGDDFVVITAPQRAENIAQKVIERFDAEIPQCYDEQVRERGYIEVLNRKGERSLVPMMCLGIAIVSTDRREFHHPTQVAEVAAEVKKYVKSLRGSHYAFDRRHN